MAKHMRVEPTETTATMRRRGSGRRVRDDTTDAVALPYGQAASYHYTYPSAARRHDGYTEEFTPARGGIRSVGRFLLLMVAWALRLCALALCLLVLLNVLAISPLRPHLTRVTDLITQYLPWRSVGLPSVDTPFGGFFRGDLSLMALTLFVLDWLVCRLRARLR